MGGAKVNVGLISMEIGGADVRHPSDTVDLLVAFGWIFIYRLHTHLSGDTSGRPPGAASPRVGAGNVAPSGAGRKCINMLNHCH